MLSGVGTQTLPPEEIAGLRCLGDPVALIRQAYAQRYRASRPHAVQRDLAELLHVGQQAVSRYLSGGAQPNLAPLGWSNLVREAWGTPADQSARPTS